MTVSKSPVLEFPAMLHGIAESVIRKVRVQGEGWAREYLNTGDFTPPRQMRQLLPGELLEVHSGVVLDVISRPRWQLYLFSKVFMSLDDGLPEEKSHLAREAFDSFCLGTPWGALFHIVSPYPLRSAERMARRLAALLRFWDVLQGPRYAYLPYREYTLEELVKHIYGMTLEAWCPRGPASVREHLALTVERMARATREECVEALLRVIPVWIEVDKGFKHGEVLSDPGFLREHLAALPPDDFEDISSTYMYTVLMRLELWDRELGRH